MAPPQILNILEYSTVDQHTGTVCFEQKSRAGHRAGCTAKSDFRHADSISEIWLCGQ